MKKIYDVFGIGNPLVDILTQVEDSHLTVLNLNKGVMHLIEEDARKILLTKLKRFPLTISAGGSCPNTMITLAMCKLKVILSGKIGNDKYGTLFEKQIKRNGVVSGIIKGKGMTGSSIILISEDYERTMNTYLGMCRAFTKKDLDVRKLKQSKFLYFTGYMWDTETQKEAILYAIEIAKKYGVKIVFDVADPFAVKRNKQEFSQLIKEHTDIVFANEEEAKMLFSIKTEQLVIEKLSQYCDIAVVKCGTKGSMIKKDRLYLIPSFRVNAIDTTGAGDMYSAGFLYGLCHNYDLLICGKIASFLASRVVMQIGAQLDKIPFDELNRIKDEHTRKY